MNVRLFFPKCSSNQVSVWGSAKKTGTARQERSTCVNECREDRDCGAERECLQVGCQHVCLPLATAVSTNTPTDCCFSFVSRQIPRKLVDDYYETSSQCSKPGIIFQTKKGRQVCANPTEDWVQEYITDLELNP
uniref:C-C motif chemokine n=1 Tax=Bos indicus x Bos taurus TaxID=30522 RepID=A0A4W2GI76_BOBOX